MNWNLSNLLSAILGTYWSTSQLKRHCHSPLLASMAQPARLGRWGRVRVGRAAEPRAGGSLAMQACRGGIGLSKRPAVTEHRPGYLPLTHSRASHKTHPQINKIRPVATSAKNAQMFHAQFMRHSCAGDGNQFGHILLWLGCGAWPRQGVRRHTSPKTNRC